MYGNRPAVIAGCSLKPRSSAQVVLSAFTTAVPINVPAAPPLLPRSLAHLILILVQGSVEIRRSADSAGRGKTKKVW